jgi:16S rRNA (uracil1498-N3)-methyltransferase
MTVRLFVKPAAIHGEKAYVEGEQQHYLTRVMRMGVGGLITLLDGQGNAYETRIKTVERDRLVAEVLSRHEIAEPPINITLYQALPKADKLDWILQKATELGASRVVPLSAAHSVVQISADKQNTKLERWHKILVEAAEQSERGRVPQIVAPMAPASVRLAEGEVGLVLSERATERSLLAALPMVAPTSLALFVGPEGGWTAAELANFDAIGALQVSLGPRILRTETAAVAGLALVMGRYEL